MKELSSIILSINNIHWVCPCSLRPIESFDHWLRTHRKSIFPKKFTFTSIYHLHTVFTTKWTLHQARALPRLARQTLPKETGTALFPLPVLRHSTMDPPQELINNTSLVRPTSASVCRSDTRLADAAAHLPPRSTLDAIDLAALAMPHRAMTTRDARVPRYSVARQSPRNNLNSASDLAVAHELAC